MPSSIDIYSVPQVANLTVEGIRAGIHMITATAYGRSTFTIFRNVSNTLDFLIRDIDRQPVTIVGELVFHIWDSKGDQIFEQALTIVNPTRGHYHLVIPKDDTIQFAIGTFTWSVTHESRAIVNVSKILYTNRDYGHQGIVEIKQGLVVPINDPYVILRDDMTQLTNIRYSSSYDGSGRSDNITGNHSVISYFNNFTGNVTIEGTLDETPPSNSTGWSTIGIYPFTNKTGTSIINFSGNYTYVRFMVTDNIGFEKLVYRN